MMGKKAKKGKAQRTKSTIRYDEALPKFTDLVSEHLGSKALRRDCFLRDADGNLTYVVRGKIAPAKRDALANAVKLEMGTYAGDLPIATPDELFDDALNDSEVGILEYVATAATQRAIFNLIAGEFMGADRRRGRTYTWVIDHLADAFHETTPRSFLIALRKAAQTRINPKVTPIDHLGIREGVQAASTVRVDQLGEDYPWIKTVLDDLEGLEVPCPPDAFVKRWRSQGTVTRVNQVARRSSRPGPIGLEGTLGHSAAEEVLLDALKSIGVVEERSGDRINMPDLFRVAAKIKRRGGVRPPTAR
ncbi:hypothetical protein [Bradyrhizobium sp. MOS003]|uniref:hypothetical protein n=1 Tax=Bradyrhizobium sp. MOS003 TaxID=2133946 RepID=UPI0011BDFF64|nr:hypothetical protein [Bradyrhizobium sp. MOS003]